MFIDRHEGGEAAVLLHVDFGVERDTNALAEFKELAISAGAEVLMLMSVKRTKAAAKYFIGDGKAQQLAEAVAMTGADVVLVNHDLSPAQERNLEKKVDCCVLDRTGLILDIFAQRAQTFEGKLQVELAQLQHLSTRLVRGWTHLERQKGGIGLRGPGETQLETDRRLLGLRIKSIKKRLEKVSKQRHQARRSRRRANIPTVSLVGYTNAGKSTLFNHITESDVFAAGQLFATLDPSVRQILLPYYGKIIIADTVGFIRDLPHDLVAAFRATLEETRQASLLLHVIDCHHPYSDEMIHAVNQVLSDINATEVPLLQVYNKIDLRDEIVPRIDRNSDGKPWRVWISAHKDQGLELLMAAMAELLGDAFLNKKIILQATEGEMRARLYAMGVVLAENTGDKGEIELDCQISKSVYNRLFVHDEN